jgi:hypothetical protein
VRHEIEDEVVAQAAAGEVVCAMIDHVVRAERPHEVELGGVVHPGHVGASPLGQLDGERPRSAAAPVDEDAVTGRGAGRGLQRDRAGLGERRGLGERQALGLVGEHRRRRPA